MNPDDVDVYTS